MKSRVFIGFSSTDLHYFNLMKAWKENDNFDFDFINMQLVSSINSHNEQYIKWIIRQKIQNSGTFIQLIWDDTRRKHKYVRWEAEVAIEKNCRIICVNLNWSKCKDDLCPPILDNIWAIFVPFNHKIIMYALKNFTQRSKDNWYYENIIYTNLWL